MLEAQGIVHGHHHNFFGRHATTTHLDDLEKPLIDGEEPVVEEEESKEKENEGNDSEEEVEKNTKYGTAFQQEVWLFVNHVTSDTGIRRYARTYEIVSLCFVIYLVVADIIFSIPDLEYIKDSPCVSQIEFFIYILFTLEYIMRLWSCMADEKCHNLGSCAGRLSVATELMNMVDFLVCTAYYITFLPNTKCLSGMGALRMIRLMRVGALLKMERKTNSLASIGLVLKLKRMELLSTVFMAAVLMVMSAAIMYYIENEAQPEAFGSIPLALWWSVTALTTVGYGDVSPQTATGKLAACLFAFFGVGIFALPAGILGEGFMDVMESTDAEEEAEAVVDELTNDIERKTERYAQLKIDIAGVQELAVRVGKGQKQILDLLQALSPELVAEFEASQQLEPQKTKPITDAMPLPEEARGLAAHCASIGDTSLASLQDKVDQRLRDLSDQFARNGHAGEQST